MAARTETTKSPKIIILEGNIAAGKSTLCALLERKLSAKAFYEPVEENPYLGLFYENPKKWAFNLQTWFLNKRMQIYSEAVEYALRTGQPVIIDRSAVGDYAFGLVNFESGNMSKTSFYAYQAVWECGLGMLRRFPPTAVVYLDVGATECRRRIREVRCREFEMGIPEDYLRRLGKAYQKVLEWSERKSGLSLRIIRLDWSLFGGEDGAIKLVRDLSEAAAPSTYTPAENAVVLECTHPALFAR